MKTSTYVFALGLTALTACALDGDDSTTEEATATEALTSQNITGTFQCNDDGGCSYKIAAGSATRDCFITNVRGNLHAGGTVSVGEVLKPGAEGGFWLYLSQGLGGSVSCIDGVRVASHGTWTGGQVALSKAPAGLSRVCGFTSIESQNGFGTTLDNIRLGADANQNWFMTGYQYGGAKVTATADCWDEPSTFGPFTSHPGNTRIPPTGVPKACSLTELKGIFGSASSQTQVWWNNSFWQLYAAGPQAEAYCFN